MGDVMLALREAEKANVRPTRIQLQKFIYLTDVLGQVVGLLKPREGHKTYFRGPYDAAIQNAIDSLAFRGFARIAGVWKTPSGDLGTSYTLAGPGLLFLEKFRAHPSLVEKVRISELVGEQLQKMGWKRIVQLVYAEPTYVSAKPNGWGVVLKPENGLEVSAAFVVAIMRRVASTLSHGKEATPEWLTERFFAFMSDYDISYNGKREVKS